MTTYFELHDYKDARIVKEVLCKECEGDGCSMCTVFCGDCLTPVQNCGCLK
jgi:hypothetical protein